MDGVYVYYFIFNQENSKFNHSKLHPKTLQMSELFAISEKQKWCVCEWKGKREWKIVCGGDEVKLFYSLFSFFIVLSIFFHSDF